MFAFAQCDQTLKAFSICVESNAKAIHFYETVNIGNLIILDISVVFSDNCLNPRLPVVVLRKAVDFAIIAKTN